MLRNILAAALRNLGRNGLYAAITILGLTLGLATAILIGLFVRDEFSYDRFIPGYKDVYTMAVTIVTPPTGPVQTESPQGGTAPPPKRAFPEDQAGHRMGGLDHGLGPPGRLPRHEEHFGWA